MTTKSLPRHTVEFFAASPRLARAYRNAVRHNRSLARFVEMHELVRTTLASRRAKRGVDLTWVVLSHIDEDHSVLTELRSEPVVSGAFHVLFTEPATHPDQVAQWMRSTNIRSENRLHVVRVEDLDAPEVSQLLGRVCNALKPDGTRGGIIDVYLAGDSLIVRGAKHRVLHVPVRSIDALSGERREVLRNFVIDPDGSFVHWPELDVHLGWNQFLQAVDPDELRKAQQRTEGYNKRYGAAIRMVRERAGLLQSRIQGLTARQVRRIERGESRATRAALEKLAKAHQLETNAYMERLATAMR